MNYCCTVYHNHFLRITLEKNIKEYFTGNYHWFLNHLLCDSQNICELIFNMVLSSINHLNEFLPLTFCLEYMVGGVLRFSHARYIPIPPFSTWIHANVYVSVRYRLFSAVF